MAENDAIGEAIDEARSRMKEIVADLIASGARRPGIAALFVLQAAELGVECYRDSGYTIEGLATKDLTRAADAGIDAIKAELWEARERILSRMN